MFVVVLLVLLLLPAYHQAMIDSGHIIITILLMSFDVLVVNM